MNIAVLARNVETFAHVDCVSNVRVSVHLLAMVSINADDLDAADAAANMGILSVDDRCDQRTGIWASGCNRRADSPAHSTISANLLDMLRRDASSVITAPPRVY